MSNLRDKMFPTTAEYKAVGRYAKMVDPGMVERMKEDGYSTTLTSIGEVMLQCDPEMFYHILDNNLD